MMKGLPEPLMYKNRLQEYTQKLGLPLPEYRIRNEGFEHAPKFRSCVLVNGQSYASRGTFPHRKGAEQDAAKVALENITEMAIDEGCFSIQNPTFCKLILFEYAVKMNLKRPEYTITSGEEARPIFISTLVFDGKIYKGEEGRSKKMAEQLAARVAIRSLLESGSGLLRQIINSKAKVHGAVLKVKDPSMNQSNLPIGGTPDVSVVSSEKAIGVSPSTSNLTSVGPIVNCDSVNKRKAETGNWPEKKMQHCLQF